VISHKWLNIEVNWVLIGSHICHIDRHNHGWPWMTFSRIVCYLCSWWLSFLLSLWLWLDLDPITMVYDCDLDILRVYLQTKNILFTCHFLRDGFLTLSMNRTDRTECISTAHSQMVLMLVITQRRSVAKNVGCFRRNCLCVGLWVCLFVYVFVNTITSERINTRWWNLGVGASCKNLSWVRIWEL